MLYRDTSPVQYPLEPGFALIFCVERDLQLPRNTGWSGEYRIVGRDEKVRLRRGASPRNESQSAARSAENLGLVMWQGSCSRR